MSLCAEWCCSTSARRVRADSDLEDCQTELVGNIVYRHVRRRAHVLLTVLVVHPERQLVLGAEQYTQSYGSERASE
jgi:hypothetical protein